MVLLHQCLSRQRALPPTSMQYLGMKWRLLLSKTQARTAKWVPLAKSIPKNVDVRTDPHPSAEDWTQGWRIHGLSHEEAVSASAAGIVPESVPGWQEAGFSTADMLHFAASGRSVSQAKVRRELDRIISTYGLHDATGPSESTQRLWDHARGESLEERLVRRNVLSLRQADAFREAENRRLRAHEEMLRRQRSFCTTCNRYVDSNGYCGCS